MPKSVTTIASVCVHKKGEFKLTITAVEVGVPKFGNCLQMYTCMCPSQCSICAYIACVEAWPIIICHFNWA